MSQAAQVRHEQRLRHAAERQERQAYPLRLAGPGRADMEELEEYSAAYNPKKRNVRDRIEPDEPHQAGDDDHRPAAGMVFYALLFL